MFTGIVEALGRIRSCKKGRGTFIVEIETPAAFRKLKIGASLAVNGVCLTVLKKKASRLFFNGIRETLKRSTLGMLTVGEPVNLERPMKASGRLDGHVVLGHVDARGKVHRVLSKGAEKDILIGYPAGLRGLIVEKGSVTVDGVSLTVGKVSGRVFWVHLIPHTLRKTRFKGLREGDAVNLEADALARWAKKKRKTQSAKLKTKESLRDP